MESRAKITERYLLFSIWTLLKFSLCRTLFFFSVWVAIITPDLTCIPFKVVCIDLRLTCFSSKFLGKIIWLVESGWTALVPKGGSWLLEELDTGGCYLRKMNIPGQPQNVSAAPRMSTLMRYRVQELFFLISSLPLCLTTNYCNI